MNVSHAALGASFLLLVAAISSPAALSSAAEPSLVAPGAKVEKLAGGFVFTEGPAADRQGNVYFSDIPNNRIHRYGIDGKLTTFREDSGAANGLYFDDKGNLIACQGGARRLAAFDSAGKETVLADKYDGKPFNSPNDLWIDPQGGVYFSDPRYGNMQGLEQDGFHVYYLSPDRKRLLRVTSDLVKPNGVLGTPDGKHLYVADAGAGKTYEYSIKADGTLADRKLFAPQGSDGLTRDERGNVYLTGGGVVVYDAAGNKLETIAVPEGPANVTFGGVDRKTLFITARTGLYAVKMNVKGQ